MGPADALFGTFLVQYFMPFIFLYHCFLIVQDVWLSSVHHDNSLSLGWSLHPPLWDIIKGLFWASVWRRHSSFEPNSALI